MGSIRNWAGIRVGSAFAYLRRRNHQLVTQEFKNKILIGTHHKTGSVWILNVFRRICPRFGIKMYYLRSKKTLVLGNGNLWGRYDVFFHDHSQFDLGAIEGQYWGLHLIRDPRDRIISGCFYHQKSNEKWLHRKNPEFGGMTYQERINSIDNFDDKILFEMEHEGSKDILEMAYWDYENPAFIEVKYEDLISDVDLTLFHKIFTFLGFPGGCIPEALKIAYDNSLFSGKLSRSVHVRSGKARQWEEHFKPQHKRRFVELFGDVLVKLGYEKDNSWVDR